MGDKSLLSYLIVTLQEKKGEEKRRRREEEKRALSPKALLLPSKTPSPLLFSFLLLQCDNEVGEEGFIPQSPPPSLQNPFSSPPRAWAAIKRRKRKREQREVKGERRQKRLGRKAGSEQEVKWERVEANAS